MLCFASLTWNLMCRSISTAKIRTDHLAWDVDALTILFAHTKKNKDGSGSHARL